MEDDPGMAGGWQSHLEKVPTVTIEAAEIWRLVEALARWNGTYKVAARISESRPGGKSKERTDKVCSMGSKVTCWRCWQPPHGRKYCPGRKSKEEREQGEKSQ